MSQEETLQHTIAQEEVQPKKVMEEIEASKEESVAIEGSVPNDSKVEQPPQLGVAKSNSENSLGHVNLADSLLPDAVQPNEGGGVKEEEVEQVQKMAEDFFYEEGHVEQIHQDSPVPEAVVKLDAFYGHDSYKRYNALILDRDTLIYAAGISYTIYNHFTQEKRVFYSLDRGGIGSIAVHPNHTHFAIAQMGTWPNIYIYEWPSLKLYRVLRRGTERSYSSINFSGNGERLASVGSDPDFLLTVWEWKQERLVLKSKAFSQEIYKVSFNQFNEDALTTSGTGHIRFWKIAQTFTGLKLQGDIAKFGQFELSDVVSYAEYEDGNVLSSSEYGKLLLWEGNLIKSVVAISAEEPCHRGPIQFVRHYNKKIISAGGDGYVRFWDAQTINQGESDEQFNFYLKPEKQIYFETAGGRPAHLLWIDIDIEFWLVQDSLGILWKYNPQTDQRDKILTFNSGRVHDFTTSPLNNCLVTAGQDGALRLWDFGNRKQFYHRHFANPSSANCIDWIPFSKKNNGRMLVAGFEDGVVRFVGLDQKGFSLIRAFKVHKKPIKKVKCNRDGGVVVVCDTAGSLFFLSLDSAHLGKITPYCLLETGWKVNDMQWDRTGDRVLVACQDGKLHEVDVPKEQDCDYSETYLKEFTSRSYTIKMLESQKPNRQELQMQMLLLKTKGVNVDDMVLDVEWDPAPILNAAYYDKECTKVLCSVDGNFLGNLYIIDFNRDRPTGAFEVPKLRTSYLNFSDDLIMIGYMNGSWELRHKYEPSNYLRKHCFDQNYGIVRRLALNIENTAVMAASEDGTMLVHRIDYPSFIKGVRGEYIDTVQISIPNVILGISPANFADKLDYGTQAEKDIADSGLYCLQDEKLKAEEDMKLSEADKVKLRKIKKIKELQNMFQQIVEANQKENDQLAKLTEQEMIVDPEYTQAFQKRIDDQEEETRKELAWEEAMALKKKQKLEDYFVNSLEYDKFAVKGINKSCIVSSFKMSKLSQYVRNELEAIERIIEEEKYQRDESKDRTMTNIDVSKQMMELRMKTMKKDGREENQEVKNKIRQAESQFEKELAHAVATKGDYKLKSAPEYVVPENERLNVSRKKKHLFLHYQYLFEEKKEFNSRLNSLRLAKRRLVQQLEPTNTRLRQINRQLGLQESDIRFEIDEDVEMIEAEIEVDEEDIQEFLAQKEREKQASKKTTGMGMAAGNEEKEEKEEEGGKLKRRKKKKEGKKEDIPTIQIKQRPNLKIKSSPLEEEIRQIQRIKLESEKAAIKQKLEGEIAAFDEELEYLKSIKYQLQSDLNLVEMRLLTFSQEFIIFRDMETYDKQLMGQLTALAQDKNQLETTFITLSNEISEVEGLNDESKRKYDEEKKILREFVYPDDDQMRERIIRYYKIRERKRISKMKKQAELEERQKANQEKGENEEDQEDQEEEEEESSEEESEDEFQDQDEKPDITVIENDHKNFERVRKICEYDQKIEEYSRKKSELEKQRNQINNKIKTITTALNTAEKELKAYQKKKLLKINQVVVSLPVSFSQIEYLLKVNNRNRLPEDFQQAILFSRPVFGRLGERIRQLEKETSDIVKKQTNLKKKLTKLVDQVEKASNTIEAKRREYEEKQLLKFGSTFELERLKELEPSDQVKELTTQRSREEREVSKRIQHIREQLQERKRQLLEAKRQNTKVINEITELGERENDLKKKLDSTGKQLFKNQDIEKKDQLEKQRQNLKDLIKFLSKQIQDLKTQIGLFKRKGGHIYTMVTSNKRNFN